MQLLITQTMCGIHYHSSYTYKGNKERWEVRGERWEVFTLHLLFTSKSRHPQSTNRKVFRMRKTFNLYQSTWPLLLGTQCLPFTILLLLKPWIYVFNKKKRSKVLTQRASASLFKIWSQLKSQARKQRILQNPNC